MICSQCGREIPDNSLSCNYCGKIFVTKRASLDRVDGATLKDKNVASLTSVNQAVKTANTEASAVTKAVQMRRFQRWFFYAVIGIIFSFGVFYVVKITNENTALISSLAGTNTKLNKTKQEMDEAQKQLAETNNRVLSSNSTLEEVRSQLTKTNSSLSSTIEDNRKLTEQVNSKEAELIKISVLESKSGAALRNLLLEAGIKTESDQIAKVKLGALDSYQGVDTDKDGILDEMEPAIGTDPMLGDSDSDGFTDSAELLAGYNPLGKGVWLYDAAIADKYKGKFLLQQVSNTTYAWYVSLGGLRYYLGSANDNFGAMRNNTYWTREIGS